MKNSNYTFYWQAFFNLSIALPRGDGGYAGAIFCGEGNRSQALEMVELSQQ